eukprot:1159095-Rhodomonas_salina.2
MNDLGSRLGWIPLVNAWTRPVRDWRRWWKDPHTMRSSVEDGERSPSNDLLTNSSRCPPA